MQNMNLLLLHIVDYNIHVSLMLAKRVLWCVRTRFNEELFLKASAVNEATKKVIYHLFCLSDEGSLNNKKIKVCENEYKSCLIIFIFS